MSRVRVPSPALPPSYAESSPPHLRQAFALQDAPGLSDMQGAVVENDKAQVEQALRTVEGHVNCLLQVRIRKAFDGGRDALIDLLQPRRCLLGTIRVARRQERDGAGDVRRTSR